MRLIDRTVDLVRLTIERDDGATSSLTAREGALLAYLAERPEQDVSRDELLAHVWEYRANFATRAVDVAMRRLRAKVEPDPSNPVHLISVHGVGYRFVPPAAELPQRVHVPDAPATNLPADQTSFVGRADDLGAVARLYRGGARLVTLLGPGGIGKTRLAQRFGRTVFDSATPAGGVWFCDLTAATQLSGVLSTVAASLRIPVPSGADGAEIAELLGHALAERGPTLLVLDNFEQVVSTAEATVGRWLVQAPEARFLVASRTRLRVAGESVYELGPLAEDDALSLFVERARAAGADLDEADSAIREIIRRLDGLPLAIELAAPRARVLAPLQLLDRLSARFRLLRSAGPSGGRQSTLQGAIDWSWELLTPWERDALVQCAIFAGGFTLEAVEAVVELTDPDAPWALDVVEALRDKSLLRVYEPPDLPGELRFGMYESIRAYALDRLQPAMQAEVAVRHAAFLVQLGEELADALEGHDGIEAQRRLALEADNLLAVWRRREQVDPRMALRAVLALEPLFQIRGPLDAWLELADEAVALARSRAPDLLATALVARASARGLRGRAREALADLEDAQPLVEGGRDLQEVRWLYVRAVTDGEQARPAEARDRAEQGVALARRLGLRRWEGILLGLQAALELQVSPGPQAEQQLRQALAIHESCGNARYQALTLSNLSMLHLDRGGLGEAERTLQQAMEIDRRMQNPRRVASSTLMLAAVRCEQWRLDEAEALAREALRAYRSVGYRRFSGMACSTLGAIALAQGRLDTSLDHLRQAVDTLEDVGDRYAAGLCLAMVAAVHAQRDEVDEAATLLDGARERFGSHPSSQGFAFARAIEGFVALGRARRARRQGADDEAAAHFAEARKLREGEPGDDTHHDRRFMAAVLDRAIASATRDTPRGPW